MSNEFWGPDESKTMPLRDFLRGSWPGETLWSQNAAANPGSQAYGSSSVVAPELGLFDENMSSAEMEEIFNKYFAPGNKRNWGDDSTVLDPKTGMVSYTEFTGQGDTEALAKIALMAVGAGAFGAAGGGYAGLEGGLAGGSLAGGAGAAGGMGAGGLAEGAFPGAEGANFWNGVGGGMDAPWGVNQGGGMEWNDILEEAGNFTTGADSSGLPTGSEWDSVYEQAGWGEGANTTAEPSWWEQAKSLLNSGKTVAQVASQLGQTTSAVSALGSLLGAGLGLAGGMQTGASLEKLSAAQIEADKVKYETLLKAELDRYTDMKATDLTRYNDIVAREMVRYNDTVAREGLRYEDIVEREGLRYEDIVGREQTRFDTLAGREDERIATQRGDIEFGRSVGAPYRQSLADLYADPSGFLNSPEVTIPTDQAMSTMLRQLSVQGGNPFGNPGGLTEANKSVANSLFSRLGEEKNRLGTLGGLASYNAGGATIPGTGTTLSGSVPGGSIYTGGSVPGASIPTGGSLPTPGQVTQPPNTGPNMFDIAGVANNQSMWKTAGSSVTDFLRNMGLA